MLPYNYTRMVITVPIWTWIRLYQSSKKNSKASNLSTCHFIPLLSLSSLRMGRKDALFMLPAFNDNDNITVSSLTLTLKSNFKFTYIAVHLDDDANSLSTINYGILPRCHLKRDILHHSFAFRGSKRNIVISKSKPTVDK